MVIKTSSEPQKPRLQEKKLGKYKGREVIDCDSSKIKKKKLSRLR